MLKWTIISLRWQWYLSGRTTSVHWSKNCCGFASVRKADRQSAHYTAASIPLDGRCHWCDISHLLLLLLLSSSVAVSSDWRSGYTECSALNIFYRATLCSGSICYGPVSVCLFVTSRSPAHNSRLQSHARIYTHYRWRGLNVYRVLYKNGWTDWPQSPKPTPIHAKCSSVTLCCFKQRAIDRKSTIFVLYLWNTPVNVVLLEFFIFIVIICQKTDV